MLPAACPTGPSRGWPVPTIGHRVEPTSAGLCPLTPSFTQIACSPQEVTGCTQSQAALHAEAAMTACVPGDMDQPDDSQ